MSTQQFDEPVAFDNAAGNLRNPNHPPREVIYGSNTTGEMSELWLQVVMAHYPAAAAQFETALPLHPQDKIARKMLKSLF